MTDCPNCKARLPPRVRNCCGICGFDMGGKAKPKPSGGWTVVVNGHIRFRCFDDEEKARRLFEELYRLTEVELNHAGEEVESWARYDGGPVGGVTHHETPQAVQDDAIAAIVRLGTKQKDAERIVRTVAKQAVFLSAEELIAAAFAKPKGDT